MSQGSSRHSRMATLLALHLLPLQSCTRCSSHLAEVSLKIDLLFVVAVVLNTSARQQLMLVDVVAMSPLLTEMQSMRERFYSTSGVAKVAPNSPRLETPTATSRLRRQPSYSPPYSRSGTLQVIRQHSSPLAVTLRPEGGLQ